MSGEQRIGRSDIPPTEDTYAGMHAARDGLPRVAPAGLTDDRSDEWLWGYDAWGPMSIFVGEAVTDQPLSTLTDLQLAELRGMINRDEPIPESIYLDRNGEPCLKPGRSGVADIVGPMSEQTTTWRPIETAPRDGTPILACTVGGPHTSDGHFVAWWGNEQLGFVEISTAQPRWQATHWMPLPPLPKGHPYAG